MHAVVWWVAVLLCLTNRDVDAVRWELLKEGDLEAGLNDPQYPIKRYGAAMWNVHDGVTVASGYMYDAKRMQPLWLRGDWWQLNPASFTWTQRRVSGVGDEDARYKAAAASLAASSRTGAVRLLLFGGGYLDGKAVRDDLSVVDWAASGNDAMQLVAQHGARPFGRHSASMQSVGDSGVVLYGGIGGRGELDAAVYYGQIKGTGVDDVSCHWERFADAHQPVPLPRRAPVLVQHRSHFAQDDGVVTLLLFGGFSENPRNFNDVWQLQVSSATPNHVNTVVWKCLHDGTALAPPSRGAAVGASYNGTLFIALGASCDLTGCHTHSDVWRFDVATQSWLQVNLPANASPVGRQFAAFATATFSTQHSLVVFGGESFHPHAYWNDVWALRLGEDDDDAVTVEPLNRWHTAHSTRNEGSLMPPIRATLPRPRFRAQVGGGLIPQSVERVAALLAFLCYIVLLRSGRISRDLFLKVYEKRRGRRNV